MSLVAAGIYQAKVVGYGIGEPAPGKLPYVFLIFEFREETRNRQMKWFGNLDEEHVDLTFKALVVAGFRSNFLSALTRENAFKEKVVEITIEHSKWRGQTKPRIKRVEEIGSGNARGRTCSDPKLAAEKLDHLSGLLKATRKEMNAPAEDDEQTSPPVTAPEVPNEQPDREFYRDLPEGISR